MKIGLGRLLVAGRIPWRTPQSAPSSRAANQRLFSLTCLPFFLKTVPLFYPPRPP